MRKLVDLMLVLSLMAILFACEKVEDKPNEDNPSNQVNYLKPNANNLISNDVVLGDNGETSFHKIEKIKDEPYFAFIGYYNDNYVVGKISEAGNIVWKINLSYRPNDITTKNNQIILIGNNTSYNVGNISIYDYDGTILSELTYNEYSKIEFRGLDFGLDPGTNSQQNQQKRIKSFIKNSSIPIYIVGRVQKNGNNYPCIVSVSIKDGVLQKKGIKVFESMPNQVFRRIRDSHIVGNKYVGDFSKPNYTQILVAEWKQNSTNLDIVWSNTFSYNSRLKCRAKDFIEDDDNLYIVGETQYEKSTSPSNGGYWYAGFIASYSKTGHFNYIKAINASEYDDKLSCIKGEYSSGKLLSIYASGVCFGHIKTNTKKSLGYGLISKINPVNGSVIENKIFGDETYNSGFRNLFLSNTNIIGVGWTKHLKSGDNEYKGWFCKMLKF